MVHLSPATICTVALAWAGVAQGMSLVERFCPDDRTAPICETSGGSPLASDCQVALRDIDGRCKQENRDGPSHCTTVATWNTCKIDVCGNVNYSLLPNINCGGYLQSVLNSCNSGGRVGGQIHPARCNILFPSSHQIGNYEYRLQFSHSGLGQY
ncbi:hypothetical protein C8Q80DRAFT_1123585 [Daedaleopsis nitida]|nr:hypothetical protein C8Q80DRAFT_1123585 [Daedaleopsis nitida]